MIDAATLTPERRREAMPDFTACWTQGFLADFRKAEHWGFDHLVARENGYVFEWRKP